MSTTIGLVFDFDDTLAPDSTTRLLRDNEIDVEEFWLDEFIKRVESGYEPTVAYLLLILDKVGNDKELGEITQQDLRDVGERIELYPGLPDLFDDLNEIVDNYNVSIEYYAISEGLEEIIRGTKLSSHFNSIYGSKLDSNEEGVYNRIQRPISFTDKTRYLFEINKGISQDDAVRNPYLVNQRVADEDRRIPFENIIYVGDGVTDIPCFSLVKERNGRVFGVLDEGEDMPKQQAIQELGSPRRVSKLSEPDYRPDSRLGSLIRLTVERMCTDKTIDELEAI